MFISEIELKAVWCVLNICQKKLRNEYSLEQPVVYISHPKVFVGENCISLGILFLFEYIFLFQFK